MKVLITGNMGYVGPVVARHLRKFLPEVELHGFDSGYFAHCLTGSPVFPEVLFDHQHFGDTRDFPAELLDGVDAVIHLAAISNDPMGNRFEAVTAEINCGAGVQFAKLARDKGVRSFVFASSCSVYGVADGPPRCENDPLNPVTAYAKSKIAFETALKEMDAPDMIITCLRFATACGMSERLRLDLVLNDFVACALAGRRITVLSDGTPWRPLIDVHDMARAMHWAIMRKPELGGRVLVMNTSADSANYQVRDLANAVANAVPGTRVDINTSAPADSRSYKVDFSLFKSLAPEHQPQCDLYASIAMLKDGLERMSFADTEFRNSEFMRLRVLERHIAEKRLLPDLRWARGRAAT